MTDYWWKFPQCNTINFWDQFWPDGIELKVRKGPNPDLCAPLVLIPGGWLLCLKVVRKAMTLPSQQNQRWAGHMAPQQELGSPWWEWCPSLLCRTCKDGDPFRISAPTSLFGFTSNCTASFLFCFKSWLHLEMTGVCSAPAVLIGLKFLGNLNTGVL